MSLREKTISGAKWSAIATVIIIGLGLVQMTVLARIIDNHQFGLLTVSLVIIALADTLSDFGIANSIIQRKEISHLELTTLYWLTTIPSPTFSQYNVVKSVTLNSPRCTG